MDALNQSELQNLSLEDIERICVQSDPVIRNLQITQCYHELAAALAGRLQDSANWCTFATWASRQAGQTIRKEDLARAFGLRMRADPGALQAAESLRAAAPPESGEQLQLMPATFIEGGIFSTAIDLASDAVGRGNLKVFAEIGREFARFCARCLADENYDADNLSRFCEQLRPGEPPEGQGYLRQAFTHYYLALFENDAQARAEWMLLANIEIGFHEQTRLQPEIAESLDAGLTSSLHFARRVLARLFPFGGWFALLNIYLRRLLGRPTTLDRAIQALLDAARFTLRQMLTEAMLSIQLPSGVRLRLGDDLALRFPPNLEKLSNPELTGLLAQLDPTPDSPVDSGALDWADLKDRLHFIVDLFRCYQETAGLFAAPFTPEQAAAIKAGRLPEGEL